MVIVVDEYQFGPLDRIFLQYGTEEVPPHRSRVSAILVDGSLVAPLEDKSGLNYIISNQLQARGEGSYDKLTESEVDIMTKQLSGEEKKLVSIRSVVQVPPSGTPQETHQSLIDKLRGDIVKEFGKDVLSGKLHRSPPERGPFGMAHIRLVPGANPKRQRSFKMVGEREEALKKIIEEYIDRGWLEPSFSEWGSPCFVVPKKVKGSGDWWWTIGV